MQIDSALGAAGTNAAAVGIDKLAQTGVLFCLTADADEILVVAKDASPVSLILLLITLPFTAMYMLRLYILTFMGEPKDHHVHDHADQHDDQVDHPPWHARPTSLSKRCHALHGQFAHVGRGWQRSLEV